MHIRVLLLTRVLPHQGETYQLQCASPAVVGRAAALLEMYDLLPEEGFDILH
jgi:hypothetical protein